MLGSAPPPLLQCDQWIQEAFGRDSDDIPARLADYIRAKGDAFFTQSKSLAQPFLDVLQKVSRLPLQYGGNDG